MHNSLLPTAAWRCAARTPKNQLACRQLCSRPLQLAPPLPPAAWACRRAAAGAAAIGLQMEGRALAGTRCGCCAACPGKQGSTRQPAAVCSGADMLTPRQRCCKFGCRAHWQTAAATCSGFRRVLARACSNGVRADLRGRARWRTGARKRPADRLPREGRHPAWSRLPASRQLPSPAG